MVIIRQHYLNCLAQAGYSIESNGEVFVIDPRRDIEEFVNLIEEKKLKLSGVLLTHLHADFIAGHQELSKKYQAKLYIGKGAQAEYPHEAIEDKMQIAIGSALLEFWETPGHTPGDISTLVFDITKSSVKPIAIFTGDTLFNGDVGRPDLLASFGFSKEELVKKLYTSVQRIMNLPPETIVYPAHGAGSLCGKSLGAETSTTIGAQKEINYAVKAKSFDEFASLVTTGQTDAPKYFATDALLNKQGLKFEMHELLNRAKKLSLADLQNHLNNYSNFHFVDTRDVNTFSHEFIKGFINIGLEGWFASWSGMLIDNLKPVVLMIASEDKVKESITRLARVGIENIEGYFIIPEKGLKNLNIDTIHFEHLTGDELKNLIAAQKVVTIDVRNPAEILATYSIPDSINIPLNSFSPELIQRELSDKSKHYVAICAGGYRSSMAASFLLAQGYNHVSDLAGGFMSLPR